MASYIHYRLGQHLAVTLPLRTAYWIAERMADIQYARRQADQGALLHNLSMVVGHPRATRRMVRGTFRNFGRYLVDMLRMPRINDDFIQRHVHIQGWDHVQRVYDKHGGAIAVTAHVGNWELAGAITAHCGLPVAAIALDHEDPSVTQFFRELRRAKGVSTISLGQALHQCQQYLRDGHVVAIVGDYDYSAHGVRCEFLGRDVQIPRGPALLSLRSGVPIVPGFLVRRGAQQFQLCFEPPIPIQRTRDRERDIQALSQQFIRVVERYVRQYPSQWFLFRPFDAPDIGHV